MADRIPEPKIARYDGHCDLCDRLIWGGNDEEEGEEIVPGSCVGLGVSKVVHYQCALDAEEQAA